MSFIRSVLVLTLCALTLLPALADYRSQAGKNRQFQEVRVRITKKGFEPKTFTLKPEVPARIVFVRETSESCGTEILLKDYGISRPLPLNKPVVIEFTPQKSGEFRFTCGMDMLRGKIIVQ